MKSVLMVMVAVMVLVSCEGSSSSTAPIKKATGVSVNNSDIVMNYVSKNTSSIKKEDGVSEEEYPKIDVLISFHTVVGTGQDMYVNGACYGLDASVRSITLNDLVNQTGLSDTSVMSYINAGGTGAYTRETDGSVYYFMLQQNLCHDYTVVVNYYNSAEDVITSTKNYPMERSEYVQKFNDAGLELSLWPIDIYYFNYLQSKYSPEYNDLEWHEGMTIGELGAYDYTVEQGSKVAVTVDFDVAFEE